MSRSSSSTSSSRPSSCWSDVPRAPVRSLALTNLASISGGVFAFEFTAFSMACRAPKANSDVPPKPSSHAAFTRRFSASSAGTMAASFFVRGSPALPTTETSFSVRASTSGDKNGDGDGDGVCQEKRNEIQGRAGKVRTALPQLHQPLFPAHAPRQSQQPRHIPPLVLVHQPRQPLLQHVRVLRKQRQHQTRVHSRHQRHARPRSQQHRRGPLVLLRQALLAQPHVRGEELRAPGARALRHTLLRQRRCRIPFHRSRHERVVLFGVS